MESNERLREHIYKLSLVPGDILVVHDLATLEQVRSLRLPAINFSVPILYSPDGIETCNIEQLEAVLQTAREVKNAEACKIITRSN